MATDEDSASSAANVVVPDRHTDASPDDAKKRKAPSSEREEGEAQEDDAPPKRAKLDERDSRPETQSTRAAGRGDGVEDSRKGASSPGADAESGELKSSELKSSELNSELAELPRQGRASLAHTTVSPEERRRGRRLFGSVLSTLSQTPASSQHKRLEIERRQQERAQQQRAADDRQRADRAAKLDRIRRIEQVQLDEEVLQTRHSTLLATAHSLQTESQPKIYYRPWEPTKAQQSVVEEQMRQAHETIEKERQEYRSQKEQTLRDLGATVGEPVPLKTANQRAPSHAPRDDERDDEGGDGDVGDVLEAGEDTVIY